jgi:hypothetical protein
MLRSLLIAGAAVAGCLSLLLVAGCIIRPEPPPQPPPPPPYGTNPYANAYGNPTPPPGDGGAGSTVLTEEEAKASIMAYIQGPRVAKMTQGFEFLAEMWSPERVVSGTDSASLKFEVAVEKGSCVRLIAVADPGIPKLDMYLYGDMDGTVLLDRDVSNDNYPVVSYCSPQEGAIVAETRAETGSGWFLIHVYSKKDDGTVKRTMDVVESTTP